jgi:hypothetical protein
MRAGDGNRTRTISLGIAQIVAVTPPDLGDRPSVSNRDYPWITASNGPLMARVISGWSAVILGRFPRSLRPGDGSI